MILKFKENQLKRSKNSSDKKFWSHLYDSFPLYGADIKGSLVDKDDKSSWNMNDMESVLKFIKKRRTW